MDVGDRQLSIADWATIVEEFLATDEPILNLSNGGEGIYDAVFVGGGGGGRFGAAYLQAMGGRALVIDRWPFLGGSCPHHACVPHHLFSEAAAIVDRQRWFSGELFFPPFDEDRPSIVALIELFRRGRIGAHALMNWQTRTQLEVDYVLNAPATVIDPHTVEAAGRRFRTRAVVLGMGASQRPLAVPGAELPGVHDYATIVEDLDEDPGTCVVVGGSKVAVEYGSFFQAMGCDTTIVSRSSLLRTASLRHVDEELRRYVVDGMRLRGMTILEGADVVAVEGEDRVTGVHVVLDDGSRTTLPADMVFNATGEVPNSGPAVSWLGVRTDERGAVVVDASMRTSVEDVYAIGDLIGPPMEIFKARKCGMTAARTIMGQPSELNISDHPDFLHTTYEVTWVGLSEEEARAAYDEVVVLTMPPRGVAPEDVLSPAAEGTMLYAFARPGLSGFQKCVIDARSRRVLGMHHVGYGAKDAFQYLDHLLRRPGGLTVDELAEMNELFLNPEYFIQLSRLRSGRAALMDM